MPEVRILAAAEDWRAFREVRLRALADAPDAFGATLVEAETLPDEVWRERAAAARGRALLVLEDDRPVAMGGVFVPDGEDPMIWGMWTAPEARGCGHAGRLLRELLDWCRARDLAVRLHVTEGNEAARRLYVGHGFVPTGTWEPLRPGSELRIEELRLG
ncbi:GNAT family N-acetyltransferase [Nocardioides dongkuii]|uniref:GNAT family N-acetyltransferase n=1 Tax=Nocardioides dongkuii TaxID=2760089 RepID=UPI001FD56088|nr:GNAT family N-acetyltransferase [Nocardioides dongkuii]